MNFPTTSFSVHAATFQARLAWWGWLCCALSLAFVQAVPTIPVVLVVCVALLYAGLFPVRAQKAILWDFLPWLMPMFGLISVVWSDQPVLSARAAAQVALTTFIGIMFAQSLKAYEFIAIIMYAFLASVVAALYMPGIFGAKNSFGLAIALAILSGCWVLLDKRQTRFDRVVALVALLGAPPLLITSNSEGALLGGGFALVSSFIPFLFRRISIESRLWLLAIGALAGGTGLAIAFLTIDNLFDILLLSIGKDTSLTGRTLLWSYAIDVIVQHPFGGVGLQAFWVEGNRAAERFWAFFDIYSHSGFHFHNLWLEIGVELGLFGIVIAAATVLVVLFNIFRWVLRDPQPDRCFFAGFAAFVTFRTLGEVELFVQFYLIPMVFFAGYYYARSEFTK